MLTLGIFSMSTRRFWVAAMLLDWWLQEVMKHPFVAISLGAFCIVSFAQERDREVDDKQAAREEWFYSQREYPLGQIPTGARLKAIADIKNIERTVRARRQTAYSAGHTVA